MSMDMDTQIQSLLRELEHEGQTHDAHTQEHSRRMLNVEPETAKLIRLLVRSSHRTRVLEIGTSNGYSTIWLAWSVSSTGGRVVSIDRQEWKHTLADANLKRAGLRNTVELLTGDATTIVEQLQGPFDCVFFDADRYSAPKQLEILLPRLTPDVLVLADNALSHPEEIAGYLAAIRALPAFEHMIIPVGKGLSVAYRS